MAMVGVNPFRSALLEALHPLNFGRTIANNPSAQEEIDKLIQQVEATYPPTNVATDPNLSGDWRLLYTTSITVLRANAPAVFRPAETFQLIDVGKLFARNKEVLQFGPLKLTNAVQAKLKQLSDRKFEVKFTKLIVLGLFRFDVEQNERFKGYLEITYLDDNLRISRGDKGNVFVLVK